MKSVVKEQPSSRGTTQHQHCSADGSLPAVLLVKECETDADVALSNLSEVTLILSSLDEWNRSSFSLKYSSMHCSSKSWTFFSSSSVMKSSEDKSDKGGEKGATSGCFPNLHSQPEEMEKTINQNQALTQAVVPLVVILLAPAATQMLEDHGYMTEDDEGRRKDRALVEGHDQLIALKLPNLVGDGLYLEERVATMGVTRERRSIQ